MSFTLPLFPKSDHFVAEQRNERNEADIGRYARSLGDLAARSTLRDCSDRTTLNNELWTSR